MLQRLLAREPLFGIQDEELFDEINALRGDVVELCVVKVIVQRRDLVEDDFLTVTLEGQVPADERVQDDSQRP